MINIATIDYHLEGEKMVNTQMNGVETLLDADLVIINPSEIATNWKYQIKVKNDGKKTMQSPTSDNHRSVLAARKREIESLLEHGKVIVIFLEPLFAFEGQIRNKYEYSIITNYDFLPFSKDFFKQNLKSGKSVIENSIKLLNPKNIFAPFFSAFKNEIEYTSYLDIDGTKNSNCFIVNKANKTLALIVEHLNGLIVFLPAIPYKRDNKKLLSTLIQCTKKFITKHEITPPPNWIQEYKLFGEMDFDLKLNKIQESIIKLEEEKIEVNEERSNLVQYKNLLYEQGPELEKTVLNSFQFLGFTAINRVTEDMEHDIVFESPEGKGIAEVEGKDNDSIHISKLDQLNRAVDEDFDHTGTFSQGVLIGNHYRFTKPEDRKPAFTDKVKIVAKKKNFGMLSTYELYKAISFVISNPQDEEFKKSCREKILKTEGEEIKLID